MATTAWSIAREEHQIDDGYIDIVHWECNHIDGDHIGHTYGSVFLPKPDTLIDYETFNKQSTLVVAVKELLGPDEVKRQEDSAKQQVADAQSPSRASGSVPS